ncbi:MAG: aminoacyl-tRNA hydrolase [Treponemataceae bacterium]
MISLVAFLGNIGQKYEKTRHNIAWLFADFVAAKLSWQAKFKGVYSCANIESRTDQQNVYFIKPHTFMNLSGQSISEIASFYKIEPSQILVIHDELELPLGTVSLKWSGGLGGHNGLRSMNQCFGTPDFWRLRLGIGRPTHTDIAGHVLSDFTPDENIILDQTFSQLDSFFSTLLSTDPKTLLNDWKKKNLVQL